MDEQEYWGLISLIRATGNAADVADLCKFLVLDTLVSFGVLAAVYFVAAADGTLSPRHSFGCPLEAARPVHISSKPESTPSRIMRTREAALLPKSEPMCVHPAKPQEDQENILLPAVERGMAVGALVLIIETESILKRHDVMPRASRLIQESVSSVVQKTNIGSRPYLQPTREFDPQQLSPRQKNILSLVADDLTSLQIARNLNVSESLVKKELVNIYRSLGTKNRAETVMRYRQYLSMPWVASHLHSPPPPESLMQEESRSERSAS